MSDLIHVVDIGTSVITAASGRVNKGELEVLSYATVPSRSVERGLIRDINEAGRDIRHVIRSLEGMLGRRVDSVVLGISGYHIGFQNTKAMVTIAGGEVRQSDIERVIATAQSTNSDQNVQIVHTRPQGYTIDGGARIRNPLGMQGVRLDASVHLITAQPALVRHAIKAAQLAGVHVFKIVVAPLAATYGASSEPQRDQGVVVLDMGAGTTDICVYYKRAIIFTGSLDKGAELVTQDLAKSLRVPFDVAEDIKINFGLADVDALIEDENVEISIPGRPSRWLKRSELAALVGARYEGIILGVQELMKEHRIRLDSIRDSAVLLLSGGGMSIEGATSLAEKHFEMPAILAHPHAVANSGIADLVDSPSYNTLLGLIRLGAEEKKHTHRKHPRAARVEEKREQVSENRQESRQEKRKPAPQQENALKNWFQWLKDKL